MWLCVQSMPAGFQTFPVGHVSKTLVGVSACLASVLMLWSVCVFVCVCCCRGKYVQSQERS